MPSQLLPLHTSDAAFYWQQINQSRISFLITREEWLNFHELLQANLDGLVAAGDEGFNLAYKDFSRFKSNGEAFVAWYLAIALQRDNEDFAKLSQVSIENQQTAWQGMVAAFAAIGPVLLKKHLASLLAEKGKSNNQALGLSIAATRRVPLERELLLRLIEHKNPLLRSKIYHWFGRSGEQSWMPAKYLFEYGCKDKDATVLEENAIANFLLQVRKVSEPKMLQQALQQQVRNSESKKGLEKLLAQRRCDLLATYLGHALPVHSEKIPQLVQEIPARLRLIALAHHGDVKFLPEILSAMAEKKLAAIAFWAFCFITGLDQDNSAMLVFSDEEETEPLQDTHPADSGLNLPNLASVKKWYQANEQNLAQNTSVLLGKPVTAQYAQSLFHRDSSTQITRFAAALHCKYFDQQSAWLDNRISPFAQDYWL